jgi:hypothetical protein
MVKLGVLVHLCKLLSIEEKGVRDVTLRLLNNLAFCEANEIPILNSGALFQAIDLLSSDQDETVRQSIMLLSNLALNGTPFQTVQFLLFSNLLTYSFVYSTAKVRTAIRYCKWLDPLIKSMDCGKKNIQEQVARFVINISFDGMIKLLLYFTTSFFGCDIYQKKI